MTVLPATVLTSCVMMEKLSFVIEPVAHSSIDRNETLAFLLDSTFDDAVHLLLVLLEVSASFFPMDELSTLSSVEACF